MIKRSKRFIKNLRRIQARTNWSLIKTIIKVIEAKIYGLNIKKYISNKGYDLSAHKLKRLGKKIKKNEKILTKIKKESNLKNEKLQEKLKLAKEMNITPQKYYEYKCWELNEKELEELRETLEKRKIKRELNKKWYMNVLMEKNNCSSKEALERLDIAKSKGYNYYQFILSGKYKLPIAKLKELPHYKKVKIRTTNTNKEIIKEKDNEMKKVKTEMNWNDGQLALNFFKSQVNCGCTFHEYYILKLYKLTLKQQKDYITSELWRKLYVRYCDYADTWKYFKQKPLFNEKFKKFIKRDWYNVERLNFSKFKKFIKNKDMLIYKPLDTACGIGIKKYKISQSKLLNFILYLKLKSYKQGIIEEIIKQHKTMAKLNPSTINTVRVQTITLNNKTNFLNATVRMGASSKSTTDNFSSGGIMATVDLKTGKVIGNASSKFGGVIKKHPESNIKFDGFQIPNWDKVLKTCEEAAKVVKTMPYIGWDVVINEDDSIQIIEGNHDADAVFHQYCWAITQNKGIRNTIDKYIWFDEKDKTV